MNIAKNTVVVLHYELSYSDQNIKNKFIEKTDPKKPLYILIGNSGLPPLFEQKIMGMTSGSSFDFTLNKEDAFGEFDPKEIMNIPLEEFLDAQGKLDTHTFVIGAHIPMMDENGHHVRGKIVEINEASKYIQMDFNHPLAGKDLHFKGSIQQVREATKEEIEHGHVHGEGGYHH